MVISWFRETGRVRSDRLIMTRLVAMIGSPSIPAAAPSDDHNANAATLTRPRAIAKRVAEMGSGHGVISWLVVLVLMNDGLGSWPNDLALAQRGLGRSVAEEMEGSSHV